MSDIIIQFDIKLVNILNGLHRFKIAEANFNAIFPALAQEPVVKPFSITNPAQMKNGRVRRMKWAVPSTVFCAAAISGAASVI